MIDQLNLKYYFNPLAWMNDEIFINYLQNMNYELLKQNRSILLFIDHCSAHPPNISFSNLKILFFTPNTTSILQRMDLA